MERTKEIKERLDALLHPRLEQEIEKLSDDEVDYFIHLVMLNLEQTLKYWRLKRDFR